MQMPHVGGLLVPELIFDELRGSSIEVTVPERGRIERIEQLRQITHVNTDARRAPTRSPVPRPPCPQSTSCQINLPAPGVLGGRSRCRAHSPHGVGSSEADAYSRSTSPSA